MDFTKTTEQPSNYNHLEKMNVIELLMKELNISEEKALELLLKYKNVRTAILNYTNGNR